MAQIIKWEYRQEVYQGPDALNAWGADGWEVVCTVGKDGSFLILKRPLVGRAARAAAASNVDQSSAGGTSSSKPESTPRKKFKELI